MGRKSKYDPKLHPSLILWMARAGLIDIEISDKLKVNKDTLYRWAALHEEVAEALKESRDYVDSLVENSLLKRALGFKYTEDAVVQKSGEIVPLQKMALPDVTAIIFWLKNRRPKSWRDVKQIDINQAFNEVLETVLGVIKRADPEIREQLLSELKEAGLI